MATRRVGAGAGQGGRLDAAAVADLGAVLPAWTVEGGHLVRMVRFPDFGRAMAFVNAMAELAEAHDHHPDFSVHYDRVRIELWTHVAHGLTERDVRLAAEIDALLERSPALR